MNFELLVLTFENKIENQNFAVEFSHELLTHFLQESKHKINDDRNQHFL
jgi:hypothetical protein